MLEIARVLERAGHETWCVGGAVRDALLGHPHLDWDLATAATPQQVRRLFRRTVPIGIEFGTVGVLDDAGTLHEVTTFRRDVRTDGRHAEVEFGASLDDDLARRDFTVNAIAWSPSRRELRDPFGGQQDLRRKVIRAVGEPEARMREDRLRALRAIRFAARFGFAIEPETWVAIVGSAPHLGRLSAERVKQELEKTVEQVERPSEALRLWRESGALAALVPALAGVPETTLRSLDCLALPGSDAKPGRKLLRLAALFADLPPRHAERTMKELRFSNADAAWVSGVLERWSAVAPQLERAAAGEAVDDVTIRRWTGAIGRLRLGAVFRLAAARMAPSVGTAVPDASRTRLHSLYRRTLVTAFRSGWPLELADLALDGDDLRAAGVPPGPLIGRILARLLEDAIEEPARNTRTEMAARAAELQRAWGGETSGGR